MTDEPQPRKRRRSKTFTQKEIERMEKFDRWSMKAFYWLMGVVALGGLITLNDIRKDRKEREEKHKKEMEEEAMWGEINGERNQAVGSPGDGQRFDHAMRVLQGRDDESHRTH